MPEAAIEKARLRVQEARGRIMTRTEQVRGRLMQQRQRLIGGKGLGIIRGGNPHPTLLDRARERVQSRVETVRRREFPLLMGGIGGTGSSSHSATSPERPGAVGAGKRVSPPLASQVSRPAIGGDARELEIGVITRPVIGGG